MSAGVNDKAEAAVDRTDPQQVELLEQLFRRIGEVSTLPAAATRVLQVTGDEGSAATDLLRAVEGDPALAVRILRTVNSALYSLRSPVRDLKTAITLIGFKEVRNLAMTVFVAQLFKTTRGYRVYSRQGLWDHMVAVAATSRLAAGICGGVPGDEAYLAGLLHDVGIVLVDQQIHRRFQQIIDSVMDNVPTCDAERAVLTFDHTQLGAFVARQWNFPESVIDTIRYHHMPQEYNGTNQRLVDIVSLSNYLCSQKGLTSLGMCNIQPLDDRVIARLEISKVKLEQLLQRLDDTLDKSAAIATL